jgi:predicted  nucleic acid-binding Zn-ribbon protein
LLENKDLKKQNEDLRKEKRAASGLLEDLKFQNDSVKQKINDVIDSNKLIMNQVKYAELKKVSEESLDNKIDFESNRDNMEEKYHQIIEENIKREREHKKEIFKKRAILGSIAASVMPRGDDQSEEQHEDPRQLLEDEDISDRTPILDVLIEKWKYYNKYKKQMVERYAKNAISIRDAFDKMMKFLGTDEFEDLPMVLEKMEDQMSSIEMYISQLTNQIDLLEDKKKLVEYRIQSLTFKINNSNSNKNNFVESKHNNVARLKNHIAELKEDIEIKRQFFVKLQPSTDEFLLELGQTYLSDFIPEKAAINTDVQYNESKIEELIANVEDYHKLVEEYEKSSLIEKKNDLVVTNADFDMMKKEMRNKLGIYGKDCYNNYYNNIKNSVKNGYGFDETIKKMADEIAKAVNTGNINLAITNKKKK